MNNMSVWISAFRLRTLPLAASSIIVAAGIAVNQHIFDAVIFILSLLTALLLQILSNLANDYGDALTGADDKNRLGPLRAMQTGEISATAMKRAIIIITLLTIFSGTGLLIFSLGDDLSSWLFFLGLGLTCIIAAITYTMGRFPYGYRALGDLAVFLFFGLVGVLGSFYLYQLKLDWQLLLPAASIGFLSAAVLNINNMRDTVNDKKNNKITLVVLVGRVAAFKYHLFLVFSAPVLAAYYLSLLDNTQTWQYIFLLSMSPLIKSCLALNEAIKTEAQSGQLFNEQLKNTAISTFVFAMLFALVLIPH